MSDRADPQTESNEPGTLPFHLERLAVDADDIAAFLSARHQEDGDIHLEALGKSERLATSLREVIHALTQHERLAMDADDVWHMLGRKHEEHDGGTIG